MSELIALKDLSVDYGVGDGYLSAVNKVNLTISKGEIFALVGESGCGKSTVASAIMRLLLEDNTFVSGKVEFEGNNLLTLSNKEMCEIRGRKIGMIFQNPLDSLNPVYRSGTQIAEALMIDKLSKEEAWEKVKELFKSVSIPDSERRMKSFPHELSGGMRQRVMIAMMISRNPHLLIADEPTTALDVTIEAQILEILQELREKYETSILVITHNFGIVAEIADRVGVMYAGEIVEVGDVNSVFENPLHPYTRALMSALPRHPKSQGRIHTIDGNVPRIIGKFEGCRFANRCTEEMDLCTTCNPPTTVLENGHTVRCHRRVE